LLAGGNLPKGENAMRSTRIHLLIVAFVGIALIGFSCKTEPSAPSNTNGAGPMLATAPTPSTSPLSSTIPPEPDFSDITSAPTIQQLQHDFDVFSWQSFVALNWPTDPNQTIGTSADGDNPTVWGTYIESYEVFLPNGQTPSWDSRSVPPICQPENGSSTAKLPVFRMTTKVSDQVLNFSGQAFGTGPLIDQRGGYVRYAIHVSPDAFNYILNNKLYSKEGQAAFTGTVSFPFVLVPPSPTPTPTPPVTPATVGSIVIKSAWRVLDPAQGDVLSRYHKIDAYVYTPASDTPAVKASCERQTLGLVGFHVAHKTTSSPQWIWSTFEQVDNLQPGPNAPPGLKSSFFNPDCKNCPINRPPPKPWNPNVKTTPSQITRLIPIDDATKKLNSQWQGFLAAVNPKSVWQFYELVSTQWPTNPTRSPTGDPAPQFLANATIETYIQGKTPNTSSSCIMCHNNATTATGPGGVVKFSDFSYLLERAQSSAAKEKQK
jgi:hypothetical protein